MEGLNVNNVTISENANILAYNSLDNVQISNVYAYEVHTLSGAGGANSIISNYYNPSADPMNSNQEIFDIVVRSSSATILGVSYPRYDASTGVSLVLSNLTYSDSVLVDQASLISFYQLASLGEFSLSMNDITFTNISSAVGGNLMNLQQQASSPILISNLLVSEVSEMTILVESYDTNDAHNYTHVSIQNMTAFNIDGGESSLISVNSGGNLSISDSVFYNISNTLSGAVLSAGKEKAIVSISNSEFYNNTSVQGGVFVTESESVIRCDFCTFTNNFAIDSGVVKVNSDGIFQFSNSEFTQNSGVKSSISTIFSTQIESVFSN